MDSSRARVTRIRSNLLARAPTWGKGGWHLGCFSRPTVPRPDNIDDY
jgi:hypothetical protein